MDRTFLGNILVVGQTRCGKTSFAQNLGKNKIFGNIESVDWISKIELLKNREEQIRKTFDYASVDFHYSDNLGEFETVLETLKDNKFVNIENDSDIREDDFLDRVIVMDDVSGLADKSMEFSSFLTVSRKYR